MAPKKKEEESSSGEELSGEESEGALKDGVDKLDRPMVCCLVSDYCVTNSDLTPFMIGLYPHFFIIFFLKVIKKQI